MNDRKVIGCCLLNDLSKWFDLKLTSVIEWIQRSFAVRISSLQTNTIFFMIRKLLNGIQIVTWSNKNSVHHSKSTLFIWSFLFDSDMVNSDGQKKRWSHSVAAWFVIYVYANHYIIAYRIHSGEKKISHSPSDTHN